MNPGNVGIVILRRAFILNAAELMHRKPLTMQCLDADRQRWVGGGHFVSAQRNWIFAPKPCLASRAFTSSVAELDVS